MSQIDNPYAAQPGYTEHAEPPKTSGLAITSLVCSLICCIPGVPALGALLGIIAMVVIGRNPARKGKGLAIAGILLGLILTVGQAVGGYFSGRWVVMVFQGPDAALTEGFAGNISGFKDTFVRPGATAADQEAQAFIDEVRDRYGEYVSTRFDDQGRTQQQLGQPSAPFPYVLEFTDDTVNAEAEIVYADPQGGGFMFDKIGYIIIFDQEQGDIAYPPSALKGQGRSPSGGSSPPDDENGDDQTQDTDGEDGEGDEVEPTNGGP